MRVILDTTSRVAIYQQIFEQIERQVLQGRLEEGTRLPSVREMALELRINPNTVARAYRELEREGWVVSQPGRGAFITRRKPRLSDDERREQMSTVIDEALIVALKLDLGEEELIELIRERWECFQSNEQEKTT